MPNAPIALITGSGFYDLPELEHIRSLTHTNSFGTVSGRWGKWMEQEILFLSRHGEQHQSLSHQVPFQALIQTCLDLKISAILACSIVGVVNPALPLGQLILPTELYYPDNRLPNGQACSLFQTPGEPGRGHAMMGSYFHQGIQTQWQSACQSQRLNLHSDATYSYVQGPRFNSKTEIRALHQIGVDIVSQTLGPEAVLAAEAEISYSALCFGVDYANGVQTEPTPLTILTQNMQASKQQFILALQALLQDFQSPSFEGFVYRFR